MFDRTTTVFALSPIILAGFLLWQRDALRAADASLDDLDARLQSLEDRAAAGPKGAGAVTLFTPEVGGSPMPSDPRLAPPTSGTTPTDDRASPNLTPEERAEEREQWLEQRRLRKDTLYQDWSVDLFETIYRFGDDQDLDGATMEEIASIFDDIVATGLELRQAVDHQEMAPVAAMQEMRAYRQDVQDTLKEILGEQGMNDLETYLREVERSPTAP